MGILGFVYAAAAYTDQSFRDVERVDFWFERKTSVSHYVEAFTKSIKQSLWELGHHRIADLVGEARAVGKESIPVQAADLFAGLMRKHGAGTATRYEQRQLRRLLNGRPVMSNGMTDRQIIDFSARSRLASVESPFTRRTE